MADIFDIVKAPFEAVGQLRQAYYDPYASSKIKGMEASLAMKKVQLAQEYISQFQGDPNAMAGARQEVFSLFEKDPDMGPYMSYFKQRDYNPLAQWQQTNEAIREMNPDQVTTTVNKAGVPTTTYSDKPYEYFQDPEGFKAVYGTQATPVEGMTGKVTKPGATQVNISNIGNTNLEKSTKGKMEQDIVNIQTLRTQLEQVRSEYDEGYSNAWNQLGEKALNTADRWRISELPMTQDLVQGFGGDINQARQYYGQMVDWAANAKRFADQYRKEITGAQAAKWEIEELKKSSIDEKRDGPTRIRAKIDSLLKLGRAQEKRLQILLSRGIENPTKEQLKSVPAEDVYAPEDIPEEYRQTETQRIYIKNQETGERRYSDDGGKTWQTIQ